MGDKIQGIVLQSLRYGDTSLIVMVYTRESGLKSYMVKGAFNRNAKPAWLCSRIYTLLII